MNKSQKEKLKKMLVFTLMGIICAGSIYLIFAPSSDDSSAQSGFNTDIPMPKDENIIDDKAAAYEQAQTQQRNDERMRSLDDFSSIMGGETVKPSDDLVLLEAEPQTGKTSSGSSSQNRSRSAIQSSAMAYNDINRTLGSFYEQPKEDPEKEQLKKELEELKAQISDVENRKNTTEEQLSVMEKSFQMAAKYMPGISGTTGTTETVSTVEKPATASVSGKTVVEPVVSAKEQTVSALRQEIPDAEFLEAFAQPRNFGFLTATGETATNTKNTIIACIHADQTVTDNQKVRLRLLEQIRVGSVNIPRNTIIAGTAKIQGERLGITVNFIESAGTVLPVELAVLDVDGQRGIFIPNMQELNAAKEIVANMGTQAGTSVNLSNDAGKQFLADMGRNAIQGISQFTAKKLREVKVNLKAGYRIYLISENSLKK